MNQYVVIRRGTVVQEIAAPYASAAQFFKTADGDLYLKVGSGERSTADLVHVVFSEKLAEDFIAGEQVAVEEVENLVRLGLMARPTGGTA